MPGVALYLQPVQDLSIESTVSRTQYQFVVESSSDEDLAVGLLEEAGVLIHPGYFFDFPADGFLVLSLLPRSKDFGEGVQRLTKYVESRLR